MSYLKNRKNAFVYASSGIYQSLKNETNLKLQFFISLLVIAAGFYFSISKLEWFMVLICITMVIALEMLNSAIEKLCDLYTKEQNPKIKYIKDVCAGAVLVASVFAAIIGCVVFWSYFESLI